MPSLPEKVLKALIPEACQYLTLHGNTELSV